MATKFNQGVPGVPLSALDAIQDPNTRDVLRALVDGWNVRNGDAGKGDSRFITKGEVGDLVVGTVGQAFGYGLNAANRNPNSMDWIRQMLRDLQAEIMNSRLWQELGERITDVDLSVVAEQQARIAAIQAEAETRLGFDTVQGAAINSLQETTSTQATQISGLTTRINGAESTIISLQKTTANQAQSLNSLTSRMGGAESNISTLNTTTANQANSLSILFTKVSNAEAAISLEQTTRANADNAIANSVSTQFSQVNGSLGALQSQQNTTANNVASLASSVTTLQAQTGENRALIQQEFTARVNADNDIYAKYSVKIDTNGYVSGFGFISEANNSAPRSSFIVRADSFAIGSPSGPGISPRVPFIVRTTPTTLPNGRVVPPGVYMDYAAVDQLDGVFIRAGLLEASQIYSGSEWIDKQSGYRIQSTAISTWSGSFNASSITTNSRVRFYGPGHHHYVPLNQRVRGGAYGGNVDFSVIATGVANHWVTIWYRVNGGGWNPMYTATEPQPSYGSISLVSWVTIWVGWGDYIDFGISSTASNYDPYNSDKPDIRDMSMYVAAVNI